MSRPHSRPTNITHRYGSKKSLINNNRSATSSSPAPSSSSSSLSSRGQVTSEWDDLLQDADSSYIAGHAHNALSPPTSPSSFVARPISTAGLISRGKDKHLETPVKEPSEWMVKKAGPQKPNSLLSFFKPVSPKRPRLKIVKDSDDALHLADLGNGVKRRKLAASLGENHATSFAPSSTLNPLSIASGGASNSVSSKLKGKSRATELEQLYLDPYATSGHSTLSCVTCSLSYSRTPEDIEVHNRHHKRVMRGCDWIGLNEERENSEGSIVCEEGIEWGNREVGGKIVMVDAGVGGAAGRKIKFILETVDTSLSSTSLTAEQLTNSKLFMFLNSKRKVVACALIERIKVAYQVVGSEHEDTINGSGTQDAKQEHLIQFGDEGGGAVFCSRIPEPTLLGVHRIWTSPQHRRSSLATQILNVAAARYIYGYPISRARRSADIAFSQPTGNGMDFARNWTGTGKYKVFID